MLTSEPPESTRRRDPQPARLTVCVVTNAPADRLEHWLLHALDFADEIVVTVDAGASSETVDVARRLADTVAVADLPGVANPAYDWTATRATGDWVLVLDDDEFVTDALQARLPELLADRRYSHYHVPVRWFVADAAGGHGWIRQFPWWPNLATRLFRNVGGLYRHGAGPHSAWEVLGEGCVVEDEAAIRHMNLAMLSREQRERKVADHYRTLPGADAATCEEYYLYEDYADTIEIVPCGATDLEARPGERARREADRRAERGPVPVVWVEGAELAAHVAERSDAPPIYVAEYVAHDTPARLPANRGCATSVTVRNTSPATWRSSGAVTGRVVLSYRWLDALGAPVVPQGDVTLLPRAIAPGEKVTLRAALWAPAEPGRYTLEWDMLNERVAWFSVLGIPPLRVEVEVVDVGARPRAPHFPNLPPSPAAVEPAEPLVVAAAADERSDAPARLRAGDLILRGLRRALTRA